MSIECDFCKRNALHNKDVYFISNDGAIHICEDCARLAVKIAEESKSNNNTERDNAFKQALEKTREKHADVIEQLAHHD